MGAMNPAVPAVEQPKFNPNLDPLTGEDMSADIRVTIRMMVVLDQPATPAAGTASAN